MMSVFKDDSGLIICPQGVCELLTEDLDKEISGLHLGKKKYTDLDRQRDSRFPELCSN